MSETGRMAELAHGRYTKIDPSSRACAEARGAIFNAALVLYEGLEKRLRDLHKDYDTLPHEVKLEWLNRFRLHVHGLENERHRRIFVEKYQVEPEQIEALNVALWLGLAVVRPLGEWVLQLARWQLYSWTYYPDEPNGFGWKHATGPGMVGVKPEKFIYTLTVDREDEWAIWYEDTMNGSGIRTDNPYEARNSVSKVLSHPGMSEIDKIRAYLFEDEPERDWEPETGESREAARKRIEADFRKRLTTHLNRIAERAKQEGFPEKRPQNLERDARWLLMKRIEGKSYAEIEKPYYSGGQTENADADQIKVAVNRLEDVACLEP